MPLKALAAALCLCAAPLIAQTAAPDLAAPELATFQAALARDDADETARVVDRMIDARRPPGAVLKTDPLINSVAGQLHLSRGEVQAASTYLRRATIAELPEAIRADTLFALASAQQGVGDWRDSAATLDMIAAHPLDAEQMRRLAYATASIALITDPARATALVAPAIAAATRAQDRWEGEFILGAARGLLGDLAGSRSAGDRAWNAAAHAPALDHAPFVVALLRAATAPDRDGQIAMLELAGATDHRADPWLANLLPVCGGAVHPSDFVTFVLYRLPSGVAAHVPVRASRPDVVAAFHTPLGGRTALQPDGRTPGGTVMTVRCRSLVSASYDVAPPGFLPLEDWFVERGLYPRMSRDLSVEEINTAATRLDEMEARYGANSPRLIPAITELSARLAIHALREGNAGRGRIKDLDARARGIMRAAGAPPALSPTEEEIALSDVVEASRSPGQARAARLKLLASDSARRTLTQAYSALIGGLERDSEMPSAEKRKLIETLLARFADRPDDPRRRALLVRLAGIDAQDERHPAALRSLTAAGAPKGSCSLMTEGPKLGEIPIATEDYPKDLARSALEGPIVFEVDVAADGRAVNPRIVFSSPGNLFDAITTRKLTEFRFDPARQDGKATACTAFTSRVSWRLEDDEIEAPVPPAPAEDLTTA